LSLDNSFGLGDTESDIDFLEEVSFPICVNPNFLLLERARDRNWPIVVERKNLITVYHSGQTIFLNGHDVRKLRQFIRQLLKNPPG